MGNDQSSINRDSGRQYDTVTSDVYREMEDAKKRQRELDAISRKAREDYEKSQREKHHSSDTLRDPSKP